MGKQGNGKGMRSRAMEAERGEGKGCNEGKNVRRKPERTGRRGDGKKRQSERVGYEKERRITMKGREGVSIIQSCAEREGRGKVTARRGREKGERAGAKERGAGMWEIIQVQNEWEEGKKGELL